MDPIAPPVELGDPFCLRASGLVTWEEFLHDVGRTARAIEDHDAVCNLADSRYEFCVILAAAMLNGQTSVLPPSRAERAVAAALGDWKRPLVVRKLEGLSDGPPGEAPGALLARLPHGSGEVFVFTSGSTGAPIRHVKNWTSLAGGGRLTDHLIHEGGLDRTCGIVVGTTPPQHMYGLEASVFSGLGFGHCLCDLPVFHPGDLEVVAEHVRRHHLGAITLATSPPHLRFIEPTLADLPDVRCVISATAPLHADITRRIEAAGHCRVFEIYGSTETGSMAWRQTARTPTWTPALSFRLTHDDDGWTADAPHLPGPVALADDIELDGDGFRLLGRRGDMVSIAGKRQSLGALNAVLAAMPGLDDGLVMRDSVAGEDRLTLLIVADADTDTDRAEVIAAVRRHMLDHVDPLFVPRRIRIVGSLPRSATGKIIAEDLERLVRSGS